MSGATEANVQSAPSVTLRQFVLTIFFPIALCYFLSYVFRNINAVLAPYLTDEFALNATSLGALTASYLLAFAVMQVPLGLLIDRYGVRRVQSINMLVAGGGALLFAVASQYEALVVARAMIGAGVAVSLIGGFSIFALSLPPQQVPMAMGLLMAFGGFGGILSGSPSELFIQHLGWRALVAVLGALCLAASLCVWLCVPDQPRRESGWSDLLTGLGRIYSAKFFWRVAPLAMFTCGPGFALQGLWAGVWLADVAALNRDAVAFHISAMAFGQLIGSIACGPLTTLGHRFNLPLMHVVRLMCVVFLIALALLAMGATTLALPLWVAVGFLINPMSLSYAALVDEFGAAMAGRVTTAINVLVIATSFCIQAGMGWVLDLLSAAGTGQRSPFAYAVCLGGLCVAGTLALLWSLVPIDRTRATGTPSLD